MRLAHLQSRASALTPFPLQSVPGGWKPGWAPELEVAMKQFNLTLSA